jgi:pimeloyl-ACP methyl ester carboxylesterase
VPRPLACRWRGALACTVALAALLTVPTAVVLVDTAIAASTSPIEVARVPTRRLRTEQRTTPTSAQAERRGSSPALHWRHCRHGFSCATLRLPMDYDDLSAGTFAMAVTRRPATDPRDRIGTLVVNFGGPGDPGSETLRDSASTFPAAIRRRFDLVSFDPRGTGASRPAVCVDDATFARAWADDRTPNSSEQLPSFYDGSAYSVDLVAECVKRNGAWLARLGTRNVARDLDHLRAALGERKLSFLGYSYGTVLGAVYAQEFPGRVRSMVLDSPVDLSASAEDEQRANAVGFEKALDEFLATCTEHARCRFGKPGDPRQALEAMRAKLEAGTRLSTADGRSVGSAELYVALLAALYSPSDWSFLADALQRARRGDGTGLEVLSDAYAGRRLDGTYSNFQQVLGVIVCDDKPEPLVSYDQFLAAYDELSREDPVLGPVLGAGPAGCDQRLPLPHPDETLGDVRVTGAPPVLVVGTTNDPATPFPGALDLQQRIAAAALLTVDDTRHGSYAQGNPCVDRVVGHYLVAGVVPAAGTRCGAASG